MSTAPGGGSAATAFGALALLLGTAAIWFGGTGTGALAFAPAEVYFLFPAPLSRRALLAYRLGRSQLVVILNAIIWSLVAQRMGLALSGGQRFLLAWGLISVLSLHRFGAGLVRMPPLAGPRRGATLVVRGALVAAIGMVLWNLRPLLTVVSDLGMREGLRALEPTLTTGITGAILAPFRLLITPVSSAAGFAGSFLPVLALVVAHAIWVLAMRTPFEEVAATASATQAQTVDRMRRFRAGGVMAPSRTTASRTWLPLAPTGNPAFAIVWKNTLAFLRTRMYVGLGIMAAFAVIIGGMPDPATDGVWAPLLATGGFGAVLIVLGPRMLRNDLRVDLLSLAALKAYPLTGRTMVSAQLASPAIILTLTELALMAIGLGQVPRGALQGLPAGVVAGAVLLAPPLLLGLNLLALAVQNGAALAFPAWVRLGADSGGIESVGQNLMVSAGSFLALVLLVVLPLGLGGGLAAMGFYAFDLRPDLGLLAGGVVALLAMAAELLLALAWLGRLFERSDPAAL